MRVIREQSREQIDLSNVAPIGSGGEASIYRVPGHTAGRLASLRTWLLSIIGSSNAEPQELVAKIYHSNRRTPERQAKLRHMLAHPPHDPLLALAQVPSIAWPVDLLFEPSTNTFVGYLMPLIETGGTKGGHAILNFYNPLQRKRKGLYVPDIYLYMIASNLASLVSELHKKDYVIGDINPSNFLARIITYVTVIDTDSFQVPNSGGQVYGTKMATPGFVAPELLAGKAVNHRTKEQDCFALGVLIFRLLMKGQHPYAARSNTLAGTTESEENQLVLAGLFPHGRRKAAGTSPPPGAPPFDDLPPLLQELFTACFVDGHKRPDQRPTADEWRKQLNAVVRLDQDATNKQGVPVLAIDSQLRVCDRNKDHVVSSHLPNGHCHQCRTSRVATKQITTGQPAQNNLPAPNPSGIRISAKRIVVFFIVLLSMWGTWRVLLKEPEHSFQLPQKTEQPPGWLQKQTEYTPKPSPANQRFGKGIQGGSTVNQKTNIENSTSKPKPSPTAAKVPSSPSKAPHKPTTSHSTHDHKHVKNEYFKSSGAY